MKNIKYIVTFVLLTTILTSSIAQAGENRQTKSEKIKAHKIAYITQALDLTSDEAMRFWPIYNAREKDIAETRSKMAIGDINDIDSDQEAEKILANRLTTLKNQHDNEAQYIEKFKTVLPSQKVAKLIWVEQNFKDRMVETVRRRVRDRRSPRQ